MQRLRLNWWIRGVVLTFLVPVHSLVVTPIRVPIEIVTNVTIIPAHGEPDFPTHTPLWCKLLRRGQFSPILPPKNYKSTGVVVVSRQPGVVDGNGRLHCALPAVVTAARNTTLCVCTNSAASRGSGSDENCVGAGGASWAPAFFEHYPLFAPAFSRRPYFFETSGAVIVELDRSLIGDTVILTATLKTSGSPLNLVNTTWKVDSLVTRIPFDLATMPTSLDVDATLTLTVAGLTPASHTRRFTRNPPPPTHPTATGSGASISTFQVDHEGKGVRRDGVPMILGGWFAGCYSHESAGLPPAVFLPKTTDPASQVMQAAMGQASLVTQWGRQGVTFIRTGNWVDPAAATFFLDAAAAAGVSVLWEVGADDLARALAKIADPKTNLTGNATELWQQTKGNVTMVRGHPAIAGYYACDDCCHMSILDQYGPAEYAALAQVREMIRELDPWRLMFGTVACGEPWFWSEEGAGLGIDVLMKEGYLGVIGSGFPYPAQYRVFPMTWEPLVLMPDPEVLGAPHAYRAHSYIGAVAADMYHTNAFVMNNYQFFDWQPAVAVAEYAVEATELLPSFMTTAPFERPSEALIVGVNATVDMDGQVENISARVFLEGRPPDLAETSNYSCATIVAVNPSAAPGKMTILFSGLRRALGVGSSGINISAERLFHSAYSKNLTAVVGSFGDDTLQLVDFIDGRSAHVYRVGCNVVGALPSPETQNFVLSGNFEGAIVDTGGAPGRFSDLYQCLAGLLSDDRVRVSPDTATPHGGRYSAKLNLASATPVVLPLPIDPHMPVNMSGNLTLWARASPPGVQVTVSLVNVTSVMATLGRDWQRVTLRVPPICEWGSPRVVASAVSPIQVTFSSHLETGGFAWLDDVTLTTKQEF